MTETSDKIFDESGIECNTIGRGDMAGESSFSELSVSSQS